MTIRVSEEADVYHVAYETPYELIDSPVAEVNRSYYNSIVLNRHKELDEYRAIEWFGVRTYSEVERLFYSGWPEGLETLMKAFEDLDKAVAFDAVKFNQLRARHARKDAGDILDMQAVYSGDLDRAWETLDRGNIRAQRRFTIYYNIGGHSALTAKELFWKGAVATYLATKLQSVGQPLRIIAYLKAKNVYEDDGPEEFVASFVMKDWRDALSPDHMAMTALGGFFRGIGFKAMLVEEWEARPSLGVPSEFKDISALQSAFDTESAEDYPIWIPKDVLTERMAVECAEEILEGILKDAGVQ